MPGRLRILILGSRGRLGAALARNHAAEHDVTGLGHADLDLLDLDHIAEKLGRFSFDALINTAGITSVDACEQQPVDAEKANALGPEIVARLCHERKARLIHISSDYVFRGDVKKLRSETDAAEPVNAYGRSKLHGEQLVLAACPSALVVRVAWLFGRDKDSFPDRIIKTALKDDKVSAVADKWSSPTYAEDLCGWLRPFFAEHRDASGLLHLCNQGAPSWCEYGQGALDIAADMGLPLRAKKVEPFSMEGFAEFKAARPPFTALDTSRFTALTGMRPRPWQEALACHIRERYGKLAKPA